MEMINWIWVAVPFVELCWAARLWQLGLARAYPFLTSYLIFSATHSTASVLAVRAWGQDSLAYGWLWTTTQPILWALVFCILMEAYDRMLSPYEGLRRLGQLGTYGALGAVSVVILGMVLLDPSGDGSATVWLRFWIHQERSVFLALTIVCFLLVLSGAYFRLEVPRNVVALFSVFGLILATQALLLIFRNYLGPDFRPFRDVLFPCLYMSYVMAGVLTFSLSGEKGPQPVDSGLNRDTAAAGLTAVERLTSINKLLLKVLRS